MLIYTHPACLGHEPGPEHPERPERLQAVTTALREAFPDLEWREAPLAKLGDLARVHERELIDSVLADIDGKRVTTFDPDGKDVPATREWYEPKREPKRPAAGYIGLQTHDPGDVVYFKEVSVRPLPKGE
jgi:acetoin utilization deacetylase AcuC-like enzyme